MNKTVMVENRQIEIRELRINEIRERFMCLCSEETPDYVGTVLLEDVTLDDICYMTSLTIEDMDDLTPSTIADLVDLCREVNPAYFRTMTKVLGVVRRVLNEDPKKGIHHV